MHESNETHLSMVPEVHRKALPGSVSPVADQTETRWARRTGVEQERARVAASERFPLRRRNPSGPLARTAAPQTVGTDLACLTSVGELLPLGEQQDEHINVSRLASLLVIFKNPHVYLFIIHL